MDRIGLRFVALLIVLSAIPLFEAVQAQGHGWPDKWESQDVGDVGAAGSSELVGTRLIVRGSGADVWGAVDGFHFAHTSISGNFELIAYVADVDYVHRWTKAGLMIRDGLAPDARHAFVLATPTTEKGVAFQRRPTYWRDERPHSGAGARAGCPAAPGADRRRHHRLLQPPDGDGRPLGTHRQPDV